MTDVVLLDGGMGQELVKRSKEPAHPQWGAKVMMNEPELVQRIHEEYLRAGARVITLNTYSATPGRFERFGVSDMFEDQQNRAIRLAHAARDAVGSDAAIAGCLSPLVGSYKPQNLPDYDTLLAEYRVIAALEAPHVDLFICETMSMAFEGRAAAVAAAENGRPVWVAWTLSETLEDDGTPRLRGGETIEQAIAALEGVGVAAHLLNCCPPEAISAGMAALSGGGRPFGGYANAFTNIPGDFLLGDTVDRLGKRRDLGPKAYAGHAMGWVAAGARIVGGCCETGPEHIAELARRLENAGLSTGAELA